MNKKILTAKATLAALACTLCVNTYANSIRNRKK